MYQRKSLTSWAEHILIRNYVPLRTESVGLGYSLLCNSMSLAVYYKPHGNAVLLDILHMPNYIFSVVFKVSSQKQIVTEVDALVEDGYVDEIPFYRIFCITEVVLINLVYQNKISGANVVGNYEVAALGYIGLVIYPAS
jgi:hypothetical protein